MASSSLVIEELTGKRRRLELRGGGLPFKGAAWEGTTVLATQWNPGNTEATQHVLGPQESPSSWEGEWNTTRLVKVPCFFSENGGAASDIVFASTLMTILDTMRAEGQALRVTWSTEKALRLTNGQTPTQSFKVVRIGRLESATFKVATQDDIQWSATFVWTGRGIAQKPAADRNEGLLATLRKGITAANDAAASVFLAVIRSANLRKDFVTPFSLGQLEAMVDAPLALADSFGRFANSVTNRLKNLGDLVIKVRDLPSALAGRAVDVATNAVAVCNQFSDEISRQGPEALTTRNKISNLTQAASYYGKAQRQADLLAEANAEIIRKANMRRSKETRGTSSSGAGGQADASDILAVHMPRQGDTFVSIARRYYGTADLAGPLARANGLPMSTVTPPARTVLIIPTKEVLERPDRT